MMATEKKDVDCEIGDAFEILKLVITLEQVGGGSRRRKRNERNSTAYSCYRIFEAWLRELRTHLGARHKKEKKTGARLRVSESRRGLV